MSVLANIAVTLGMLLIVPFGLALIDAPGLTFVRRWWLLPAVIGAVSLWLPRGGLAVGLACDTRHVSVWRQSVRCSN